MSQQGESFMERAACSIVIVGILVLLAWVAIDYAIPAQLAHEAEMVQQHFSGVGQ